VFYSLVGKLKEALRTNSLTSPITDRNCWMAYKILFPNVGDIVVLVRWAMWLCIHVQTYVYLCGISLS
jgi:hypothetical protein